MNDAPQIDAKAMLAKYGPWAVISGGTEGTGESFARQLAEIGFNVMLVARRVDVMEALAADLRAKYGVETRTLSQDLMEPDAAQKILDASADVDVGLYISNAGVDGGPKRFLNQPAERWVRFANMNVANLAVALHGFGNRMRQRGGGGLLVMSSGAALIGSPYLAMYSSTKAFGLAIAEALWGELAEFDIDVLGVIAPTMDTPLVMKGLEEGTIAFDSVFKCDDVVRQSLAQLGHAPTLMFGSSSGVWDPKAVMKERRDKLVQLADRGRSFVPKGGRRPAQADAAPASR